MKAFLPPVPQGFSPMHGCRKSRTTHGGLPLACRPPAPRSHAVTQRDTYASHGGVTVRQQATAYPLTPLAEVSLFASRRQHAPPCVPTAPRLFVY